MQRVPCFTTSLYHVIAGWFRSRHTQCIGPLSAATQTEWLYEDFGSSLVEAPSSMDLVSSVMQAPTAMKLVSSMVQVPSTLNLVSPSGKVADTIVPIKVRCSFSNMVD